MYLSRHLISAMSRSSNSEGCSAPFAARERAVGSRFKRAGFRWSKAGASALLAVKCRIDNNRWADFLNWRACRGAAA